MKSLKETLKQKILGPFHEIGWCRGMVYIAFLAIGIVLVIVGAMVFQDITKDILIGLGCGFIPSALTGFSIDFINAANKLKRRDEFEKSSLFGLSHGILYIAKIVIEKFGASKDKENDTLNENFRAALGYMYDANGAKSTFLFDPDNASNLLKELSYGISLCERDSVFILENRVQLLSNGFLTGDEISAIDNVLDECLMIETSKTLDTMGDYLENLVSVAYEKLPIVKKLFDTKVTLEKGRIKNWSEILK